MIKKQKKETAVKTKTAAVLLSVFLFFFCTSADSAVSTNSGNNNNSPSPEKNIRTDQFGYTTKARKTAVISSPARGFFSPDDYVPGNILKVIDADTGETVFSGKPEKLYNGMIHEQSGDRIWHFDFTGVEKPGTYYIYDEKNKRKSYEFRVSDDVYDQVMKQALRMFYLQRCGTAKTAGVFYDSACHLEQDRHARPINDRNNKNAELDLSGGWHDAGDYTKYVSFVCAPLHNLLAAYEQHPEVFTDDIGIPESGNGLPDIIDEIIWEIDWIKKMWWKDGYVLSKVSVPEYEAGSPASADKALRYYGPPSYASAITAASVFAHTSIVFGRIDSLKSYADDLLKRAEASWGYLKQAGFPEWNSEYKAQINSGFSSAPTEQNSIFYDFGYISSAIYLFAASGKNEYHEYLKNNYKKYDNRFRYWWNQYDWQFEDAYLYYCTLDKAESSVKKEILDSFANQARNSGNLYKAYSGKKDGYLSHLNDGDYVWGSNSTKCCLGLILSDMAETGLSQGSERDDFLAAGEAYLHYIHGVNALALVMLTNMYDFGAENSANEMYHSWFGDGTDWDNALESRFGPPPGYLTGGVNKYYAPAQGPNPLKGQPIQKCYLDWNTSWPENSWEITEPSLSYQGTYVRLLSRFM